MSSSFSSISRRKLIQSTAMLTALAAFGRQRALAEGGSLSILNCNVAWSNALGGPVAEAYQKKNGATVAAEPTPYDSLFQNLGRMCGVASKYEIGNSTALLYPADGAFELVR